jgi:hypothetical protein
MNYWRPQEFTTELIKKCFMDLGIDTFVPHMSTNTREMLWINNTDPGTMGESNIDP